MVIADFSLDYSVPVDQIIELMETMVRYVEARGSILSFDFLPYPTAISCDPKLLSSQPPLLKKDMISV